jgi:Dolichyl-phosphate-mannose-protein mannosyltransferase
VTLTAAPASAAAESRSAAVTAVPPGLRRAIMALAIGLIIATCVFGAGRVIWRMISMDGGWYSYPAYALSQGRDPDENMLPPEQLSLATPGVRSLFPWENRSFLLTRIDWAWFELAGHGETSIVAFGALQWLALAAFVGWGVLGATGSRWAAGAAALAALSDVQLVYESLADLRPDVPLALIGLAALCFLVNFLGRRSAMSFIACGLLTALLPLVHTTGVMPAAMMLTCVAVSALIPRDGRLSKPYMLACATLAAVTLAVFIFRKPIADVLIPTKVPLADQLLGRHDLPAMVLGMAHRGVGWKLAQERQRWTSYFVAGNLPQLLFLLTGLFALLRAAWRRKSEMAAWLLLPAGWLAGIAVLTATDPHFVPTHLIPLVAMGYVMAGVGWSLLLDRRRPVLRTQGVLALAVLAFLCLGLRTAQAAVDVDRGIHQGVSRVAVSRLLTKVFPGTGVTWAVGPTSIWMYVPQSGRTVIVDQRSDPGIVNTALWRRISVLVIDTDFVQWGWGRIARQGVAAGWLQPIGRVGKPGDKYWLEAFRVEHPGAPGKGGH